MHARLPEGEGMIKFSVLLPTRNRLDLLRYAVETVRRQDYENWEVIISDNCSEEDIGGYVQSLREPRISYHRTESFIPVTDNWNRALEKSSGDYVIMLGDDDCLMKGFFSTISQLVEQHSAPDFIYTSAYLFTYPGVTSSQPEGLLQHYGYADFLRSAKAPFLLEKRRALESVRHSLNFKVRFGYNMQFSAVSRRFIDSLKPYGKFFQSPYPDYYASNVLMLKANRILVTPQSLVTIGISPKSFGFFYFNAQETKGTEFLKNLPDADMARRLQKIILPGTNMNNSWLLAMETILRNFGAETAGPINYARYRLLQICAVYKKRLLKEPGVEAEGQELWQRMNAREKAMYGLPLSLVSRVTGWLPLACRALLAKVISAALRTYPWRPLQRIPGNYKTILDVFEQSDHLPAAPGISRHSRA
jgi:glycosyltransferase involved in cell wall biosynthesis